MISKIMGKIQCKLIDRHKIVTSVHLQIDSRENYRPLEYKNYYLYE